MIATAVPTGLKAPAPLRAAPALVCRFDSHLWDSLSPFDGSSLMSEGRVNLIALDAIAERLGERWPSRREQVYDHVERNLRRKMGPSGICVRISDTDYLVVQPDVGPFAAQAVCLRVVDEVLTFFIGPGRMGVTCVHRVTRMSVGQIAAEPVDRRAIAEGEMHEAQAEAAARRAEAAKALLSPERWSPFVASNGRSVRVSCALEPVYELKNNTRIGYRIRRRVIDVDTHEALSVAEVQRLSRGDLMRIDMATIARGIARLEAAEASEPQLSIVVPVSYVTLSNISGRYLLSDAFAHVRERVLKGVICEVRDVEGVPQGPLLSAVSLIKPRTLLTVGHIEDLTTQALHGLRDAGLNALSLSCPPGLDEADFVAWLRGTVAATKGVCKSVAVYGCESPRRAAIAALFGATHVSFAAP